MKFVICALLVLAAASQAVAECGECQNGRCWEDMCLCNTGFAGPSCSTPVMGMENPFAVEHMFTSWAEKYGKVYADQNDALARFQIFQMNAKYIAAINSENRGYELELNQFADTTFAEFAHLYLQAPQADCSATNGYKSPFGAKSAPTSVDWRKKGVVTPVKDQGHCGSCWTFSTTGAVESHWALKTGKLPSLSEQQLVDCAQAFDNHGCNGGLPSHAFNYINFAGGIMSETDYPYEGRDDNCRFVKSKAIADVTGSVNITEGDEVSLVAAIAGEGPVSIAFQVVSDFRFYKSGVYTSKACGNRPQNVNHAVLAVGYDTDASGVNYYIVKNSWNTTWGNLGYFWIIRDQNMCGLATCAAFPSM